MTHKPSISSFLICLLLSVNGYAQSVPESLFPFGGMSTNGYTTTNLASTMSAGGFNVLYGAAASIYAGQTFSGYPNEEGTSDGVGGILAGYVGNRLTTGAYTDMRFFLSSKRTWNHGTDIPISETQRNYSSSPLSNFDYDLAYTWQFMTLPNPLTGAEWHFDHTAAPVTGAPTDALLAGLGAPFTVDPTLSGHAICDFIYGLDLATDYSGVSSTDNTTRYKVIYTATYKDGSSITTESDITVLQYNSLIAPGGLRTTEESGINTYFTRDYAVSRESLITANPSGSTNYLTGIECRLLKTSSSLGLYVRGLRIRSDLGDQLLRGQLEGPSSHINGSSSPTLFSNIKADIGATAWPATTAITAGGESTLPSFRAFAYIDHLWKVWSKGKRIYPFLSNNANANTYQWFRAVYEEVTGDLPPLYVSENAGYFEIYSMPSFTYPIGYPSDLIGNSTASGTHRGYTDFTLFGYPIQNYATYTTSTQARYSQFAPTNLMQASAPPGGRSSNWINGVWCITNYRNPDPPGAVDDSKFRKQGSQLDAVVRPTIKSTIKAGTICDPPPNLTWSIKDVFNVDSVDANHPATTYHASDPTVTVSDPNWKQNANYRYSPNKWRLDNRSMSAPELRFLAWEGICYGAKGIVWNTLSSDEGEQIGLTNLNYERDYNWWDDGTSTGTLDGSGHRTYLGNIYLGSPGNPLMTVSYIDRFKIQKQTFDGTNWNPVASTWLTSDGAGNWNGGVQSLMTGTGGYLSTRSRPNLCVKSFEDISCSDSIGDKVLCS